MLERSSGSTPSVVAEHPRAVDVLLVDRNNLTAVPEALSGAGGFAVDLERLPPMDAEQLDGLLVRTAID